jgi:hypothetical protein
VRIPPARVFPPGRASAFLGPASATSNAPQTAGQNTGVGQIFARPGPWHACDLPRYERYKASLLRHTGNTSLDKNGCSELLPMSIGYPPRHCPSSETSQKEMQADPRAATLEKYGSLSGLWRAINHFRQRAKRMAIPSWLRIVVAAMTLIGTAPAAWSGDIRVGFINPTGLLNSGNLSPRP